MFTAVTYIEIINFFNACLSSYLTSVSTISEWYTGLKESYVYLNMFQNLDVLNNS